MPVTCEYDPRRRILTCTTEDPVQPDHWQLAWARVRADAAVPLQQITRTVLDFRGRKDFRTVDRIHDLVEQVASGFTGMPQGRVAILVAGNLGPGTTRMINACAGGFMHVQVFRGLQTALRWLTSGDDP